MDELQMYYGDFKKAKQKSTQVQDTIYIKLYKR